MALDAPTQVTWKVIKVFVELPVDQTRDYDFVKEAILNLFQLVPEAYRVLSSGS